VRGEREQEWDTAREGQRARNYLLGEREDGHSTTRKNREVKKKNKVEEKK
jgi:hypothetical protein